MPKGRKPGARSVRCKGKDRWRHVRPKRVLSDDAQAWRKALGLSLAEHRRRRGYTQGDVARALGYNNMTVMYSETGRRSIPAEDLREYAIFYGTTVRQLIPLERPSEQQS